MVHNAGNTTPSSTPATHPKSEGLKAAVDEAVDRKFAEYGGGGQQPPNDGMLTWKSFTYAMFLIMGAYSALSFLVLDLKIDTIDQKFSKIDIKFDTVIQRLETLEDNANKLREDSSDIKISQAKSQKDLEHITQMLGSKAFKEAPPQQQ